MPECTTITPFLEDVEQGHKVACLLFETSKPKEGGRK
jgi:hypothetical protein